MKKLTNCVCIYVGLYSLYGCPLVGDTELKVKKITMIDTYLWPTTVFLVVKGRRTSNTSLTSYTICPSTGLPNCTSGNLFCHRKCIVSYIECLHLLAFGTKTLKNLWPTPVFVVKRGWTSNAPLTLLGIIHVRWNTGTLYTPKPTNIAELKTALLQYGMICHKSSLTRLWFRKRLRFCVTAVGVHFEHSV